MPHMESKLRRKTYLKQRDKDKEILANYNGAMGFIYTGKRAFLPHGSPRGTPGKHVHIGHINKPMASK